MLSTYRYINNIEAVRKMNSFSFLMEHIPFLANLRLHYDDYETKRTWSRWMQVFSLLQIMLIYGIAYFLCLGLPAFYLPDYRPEYSSLAIIQNNYLFFFVLVDGLTTSWLIRKEEIRYVLVKQLNVEAKEYYFASSLGRLGMIFITELVALTVLSSYFRLDLLPLYALVAARILWKFFADLLHLKLFEKTGLSLAENPLLNVLAKIIALIPLAIIFISGKLQTISTTALLVLSLCMAVLGLVSFFYLRNYANYFRVFNRLNRLDNLTYDAAELNKQYMSSYLDRESGQMNADIQAINPIEFINQVFFKRHEHSLKRVSDVMTLILGLIFAVLIFLYFLKPDYLAIAHNFILDHAKYVMLIFLGFSTASKATKLMFMNCDSALLKYSFYREQEVTRLMYIARTYNMLMVDLKPAISFTLLACLTGYLYTGELQTYLYMGLMAVAMVIFSVTHYLFLYYMVQPFSTEGVVKFSHSISDFFLWLIVFFLSESKLPVRGFSLGLMAFAILYWVISFTLVSKYCADRFKVW